MRATDVTLGAARGLAAGLVAGATWWLVETAINWALGGMVPLPVLGELAALDLALGAGAGVIVSVALTLSGRRADGVALALGLAVAYGLLRLYQPPGFRAEALFLLVGVAAAALGVTLAGTDSTGILAFVQLILLTTLTTALGEFRLVEKHAAPLGEIRLALLFAVLPLAAVIGDRLLRVFVRGRGMRFGIELGAAVLAAVVWGQPLTTAPLDDPLVTAVPPPAGTPDVIMVTLDTTRADHLSTYGYGRNTSPQLTAFAADGLRFTQARSPAAWTVPGHASLFTGMYPSRHGAHLAGSWLEGESIDGRRQVAFPLGAEAVTLAEVLRDRGYSTAAFVANFSYLYRSFGFSQGFARYEDAPALLFRLRPHAVRFIQRFVPGYCLKPFRSAHQINAAALEWLDRAPRGRPVFVWVNYMEAHQPWLAPPPYDRWARDLPEARRLAATDLYTHVVRDFSDAERNLIVANYDGQIAAMDEALGELMEALRARGRYTGALVVVTADHGEFLGEHRQVGHIGRMLYEPVLHIPLVVKFPGTAPPRGDSSDPVQLVDVLPTVLAAAGAPLPPGVQGEPLSNVTHPIVAEEDINPFLVSRYGKVYDRGVRVVYDGSYKLISTSRGQHMLFDLAEDPGEMHDLADREPERVTALRQRLEMAFPHDVAVVAATSGASGRSGAN